MYSEKLGALSRAELAYIRLDQRTDARPYEIGACLVGVMSARLALSLLSIGHEMLTKSDFWPGSAFGVFGTVLVLPLNTAPANRGAGDGALDQRDRSVDRKVAAVENDEQEKNLREGGYFLAGSVVLLGEAGAVSGLGARTHWRRKKLVARLRTAYAEKR